MNKEEQIKKEDEVEYQRFLDRDFEKYKFWAFTVFTFILLFTNLFLGGIFLIGLLIIAKIEYKYKEDKRGTVKFLMFMLVVFSLLLYQKYSNYQEKLMNPGQSTINKYSSFLNNLSDEEFKLFKSSKYSSRLAQERIERAKK